MLQGLQEDFLDGFVKFVVSNPDVAGNVPGQVGHANDGLEVLELVPFIAFHG